MIEIGVTCNMRSPEMLWCNGIDQAVAFLVSGLDQLDGVRCRGVYTPSESTNLWHHQNHPVAPLPAVIDDLDVLIEAGTQLSKENASRVKGHGGKLVSFKFGNAYLVNTERMLYGRDVPHFQYIRFDEIWTNLQHVRSCRDYWEIMYKAPVFDLPQLWDARFLNMCKAPLGSYKPGSPLKIGIFEPNINLIKNAVIPILACEELYRREPEAIESIWVFGSKHLVDAKNQGFLNLLGKLDIVRDKVLSVEARYPIYKMLKNINVVLSHTWENDLNHLFYEALCCFFPLVHSSTLLPHDVGFRYPTFSAKAAADVLGALRGMSTIELGKALGVGYQYAKDLAPSASENRAAYKDALERLLNGDT